MGVRIFVNIEDIDKNWSSQKHDGLFEDRTEDFETERDENSEGIEFGPNFGNGDTFYSEDDFENIWKRDLKSDNSLLKKETKCEFSDEIMDGIKNEDTEGNKIVAEDENQQCEEVLGKHEEKLQFGQARDDGDEICHKEVNKFAKCGYLNSLYGSLRGKSKFLLFVWLATSVSVAAGFPFMGNLPPQHFVDPYKCGCKGNSDESRSLNLLKRGRVVGGDEVTPGSAPWLAALTKDSGPHCGATLISKKHLLTAAHCIDGIELAELDAWIGAHSLSQAATGAGSFKIVRAWSHPSFDIFTFTNDIAVLELAEEVTFSQTVRPICLPSRDDADYSRRTAIVTGWGRTAEQKPPSDVPRQAQVQIWGAARCKNSGYPARRVSGPVLCAGLSKGGVDACQGDSGGPLILPGPEGVVEVIGVVSWGRGCARPNLPGVYTRVASFLPFIHDVIDGACS